MKAVVMAGGQGSRLRPLTSNQPKPMLPIVGQPMMQHILRLLRRHGCTDVVTTVQFLASIIRNFFDDGSDLGVSLSYATEEEPLGTAGSVKNAEHFLDDTFIVISGDAVTDIDLSAAMAFHRQREAAVTVVTKRVEDPLEFGIVIADDDGRIDRFLEKPGWGEVFSDTINTGIYVVEPDVLEFIPAGTEYDFAADLFPLLLDKGMPMYAYRTDAYWTDVGNLDAYLEVHRDILDGKVEVEIAGFELGEGVWLGEGAEVDPEAQIAGPVYIGENSRVEAGATIREYTALGSNVVVKGGAFLHRAIVHDNAYVGPGATLRGCVVGKNTDVKHNARLEEGVVVSDECYVGDGAVLNPGVKVYPFKHVDPGALVTQSIIWESRGARHLFGERGVAGLVNIDVTPEMGMRLALAFGSMLPKNAVVTACRDVTRTARVIKRAMVAGFNAAGIDCHDLELVPAPVARHYVRSARGIAGVAVRTSPEDAASVEIQFFDARGIDIDPATQRKIERTFYRDDFRRAFHHEIGELNFPARGREYYTRGMIDSIDVDLIRESAPKLVIAYSFGAAALTAPAVLGRAGADVLAVNAVLDEERVVMDVADQRRQIEAVAGLVRASGADLGAILDPTGERIRLVDDRARVLDPAVAMLAFADIVARMHDAPRFAAPVSVSSAFGEIARSAGGSIEWTRIAPAALMSAALESDVDMAADAAGGFIFPEFLPSFDGVFSLAKLLELLARAHVRLSEVVDALPPVHIVRLDVPLPWEEKGTVMRRLLEEQNGGALDVTDGMKAFRGESWVLVVPDPQDPVVRVWAEAGTLESAGRLAAEFAARVDELRG
ncbi:MAG: NTP transferase domain-containing protein [Actinobacteria bacterium]|nr:NTP transferase domain-containing protein [Actinomycetota bacterium]